MQFGCGEHRQSRGPDFRFLSRCRYSGNSHPERKRVPADAADIYGSTAEAAAQRAAFTSLIRAPHATISASGDPRIHCPAEYGTTLEREQLFKVETPPPPQGATGATNTCGRREDLLKKVECPRPPPDVSNVHIRGNTVVTLKGHVYESPKIMRGGSFPPGAYHELGTEAEDRRGKLTTT